MTTQQYRIQLHEQDTDRQKDRFARLFGVPVRSPARTVARSTRGELEVHAYVSGAGWTPAGLRPTAIIQSCALRPVATPVRWEQARSAQL
jgi:hypothetical protein